MIVDTDRLYRNRLQMCIHCISSENVENQKKVFKDPFFCY